MLASLWTTIKHEWEQWKQAQAEAERLIESYYVIQPQSKQKKETMSNEPIEEQEAAVGPFILVTIDTPTGDPQVEYNIPVDAAIAFMTLAQQKLIAQFYGLVNQHKAQEAAKKPQIELVHALPKIKVP